jgi:hypothetical protein
LAGESNNTTLAGAMRKAIDARTCAVGIVGLGYVGLPLALTVRGERLSGRRLRHRLEQGRGAQRRAATTSSTSTARG